MAFLRLSHDDEIEMCPTETVTQPRATIVKTSRWRGVRYALVGPVRVSVRVVQVQVGEDQLDGFVASTGVERVAADDVGRVPAWVER